MLRNRYSVIDQKTVYTLVKKAQAIIDRHFLSSREQEIWSLIKESQSESNEILSCDLPTDQQDNAVMVQIVHQYVDVILGNKNIDKILKQFKEEGFHPESSSLLQKIQNIAEISFKFKAGNCQEKAFYAFNALLKKLIDKEIVNYNKSICLELAYFNNHFIVIVDNQFLLDPWLNISFKIPSENKKEFLTDFFTGFGNLTTFFKINDDWNCYEDKRGEVHLRLDSQSSYYTMTLFPSQIMHNSIEEEQHYPGHIIEEKSKLQYQVLTKSSLTFFNESNTRSSIPIQLEGTGFIV